MSTQKQKKFSTRDVVYIGRRCANDGDISDVFHLLIENSVDHALGDQLSYRVRARRQFAIGYAYKMEISDDLTAKLGSAEMVTTHFSPKVIAEWSAADAAARRAKADFLATKKLQTNQRDRWREAMEPLRSQYRRMTRVERRAMRVLVVEWLEGI